jgi:hypothetical protein
MPDFNSLFTAIGGSGGANPISQVGDYLTQSSRGMLDNSANDPVLSGLIQQGYLDWGSDAQGNRQLTPGGKYTDLVAAQQKASPGSWILGSSQQNLPDYIFGQGKPIPGMGKLGDATVTSWNKQPTQSNLDPETGLAAYDFTGVHPTSIRSTNNWVDAFMYNIAPLLLTAPISGPLMGSLAGFGSLFNLAGNELIGNKSGSSSLFPFLIRALGEGLSGGQNG